MPDKNKWPNRLTPRTNAVSDFQVYIEAPSLAKLLITPHAQRERGKVIGRGVHIYYNNYIYNVCGRKKNLNRTLEIDSPFQTLTVGLLVEFID